MTAPDAPRPNVAREHPFVSASAIMLSVVMAGLVGWFVGSAEAVPPAQHAVPASPVVIQGPPPFPAVLVQAAAAYVAHATETAPTPTVEPTPYVPPTAYPWTFCIKGAVKPGEPCEWPQPTIPPPTPYPACGTPISGDKCIWRES